MEYITKSGYRVTEEMIEEWGRQAEQGNYPGEPGKPSIDSTEATKTSNAVMPSGAAQPRSRDI